MANRADARRAIGQFVDELNAFERKIVTAATGSSGTTVVSDDLKAVPNDTELYKGGYFHRADGTTAYCTAFAQSTGTATVTPSGSSPAEDDVIEFWRKYHPEAVNYLIRDTWNQGRRKFWVPITRVCTAREQDRQAYTLPSTWGGVTRVLWNGSAVAQETAVYSWVGLKDASARTKVAQGIKFDDGDVWIRYVALALKTTGSPASATLTLTVETDSSGSPSGTSIGSATISTVEVFAEPQWVIFDLSAPVKLSESTQYHLVLASSGAVSATDYITFARTEDDTAYSNGSGKSYSGSAWSAPGYDMLFAVWKDQGRWNELLGNEWQLVPDRRLRLLDWEAARSQRFSRYQIPDMALIMLEGIRYPNEPTDSTTLEIPYDWLVNKVTWAVLSTRLTAQGLDQEEIDQRLRAYTLAVATSENAVVPWPSGTRRILDTLP